MGIIEDELDEVKKLCERVVPDSKLVCCVQSLIRVEISKSRVRNVIVCLQYPDDYPKSLILIELKSKHFSDDLLNKLCSACDTHIASSSLAGKPQVLAILKFLEKYLADYPLLCCYDEISIVKKELRPSDKIKLNQKSGQISLKICRNSYFISANIYVPVVYPDEPVRLELESNVSTALERFLVGQGKEVSRQCVEPPLTLSKEERSRFTVRPSLEPLCHFLVSTLSQFVQQHCPVCSLLCLPNDPQEVVSDESQDKHIERVYCGHLYHLRCLITLLNTPPFKGGKKCPLCNQKIYHDKWKVPDKLAEDRWSHKQARKRELEEVVDFLN